MTDQQKRWVMSTAAQAYAAGHIYPRMAACEAALESAYGASQLARLANNLFGLKARVHEVLGTISIPTREFIDGQWSIEPAEWVEYKDIIACFKDRMATLQRLRATYQGYNNALLAQNAEDYVKFVSQNWSTDSLRAEKCISIFNEVFPPANNSEVVQDAAAGSN